MKELLESHVMEGGGVPGIGQFSSEGVY